MELIFFAIKETGTDKYLQRHVMERVRSGTHYDPVELMSPGSIPLLFYSERSAQNFITQWRRGRHCSDGDGCTEVHEVPHRKTMPLDIVQVQLTNVCKNIDV